MIFMKTPLIQHLNLPELTQVVSTLPSVGKLAISANKLVYLDINDDFVHLLFPLLQNTKIKKPDYFRDNLGGAHISVIYPEERNLIFKEELNKEHFFQIQKMVVAEIGLKKYYALIVQSPSLLEIRRKHGLPDQLCFKGYAIDFHITIGVEHKI